VSRILTHFHHRTSLSSFSNSHTIPILIFTHGASHELSLCPLNFTELHPQHCLNFTVVDPSNFTITYLVHRSKFTDLLIQRHNRSQISNSSQILVIPIESILFTITLERPNHSRVSSLKSIEFKIGSQLLHYRHFQGIRILQSLSNSLTIASRFSEFFICLILF